MTGWKVMPVAGGWLDQPQAIVDDLLTIQWQWEYWYGEKERNLWKTKK